MLAEENKNSGTSALEGETAVLSCLFPCGVERRMVISAWSAQGNLGERILGGLYLTRVPSLVQCFAGQPSSGVAQRP